MHKNGKRKNSPEKIVNKFLLILVSICIVVCIILSILSIAKKISEVPPADEYVEPPFPGDMTTTVSTTLTSALTTAATEVTTAVTTTALTVAETDFDKDYFSNWLFIGDSIFTGLYGYDFLDSSNVFAKIGFTPENVRTSDINGTSVYQKLAVTKPETICIMLGTNGLAYLTVEQMIADYRKFIDEIRDLLPETKIIIVTITPVTKEHSDAEPENLSLITAYNEALAVLSEEKETDFVDIYAFLADDDGYTKTLYAENDGLHLKASAYELILTELEAYTKNEETDEQN
ncbi:MAG: GDSL-type esterase/lipase family protein [Ruminococcus sp.]|nr:GDSL-type esterase/lipase family protein [Ruminococcus sp.]